MHRGLNDCFMSFKASLSCLFSISVSFQRSDNILIVGQRITELPCGVMKDMGEDLAVAVISHVARESPAHQKFPNRHKGSIFAIRHRTISLDKEGMACVQVNCIIGVLPALRQYDLGFQVVMIKTEKLADLQRISHFLQGKHIGIERKDERSTHPALRSSSVQYGHS